MSVPQQYEVSVAAVSKLRADDALAAEIYADTTAPQPDDRQRIFRGSIADKPDETAKVAVEPIGTGSTSPKAGAYIKSYLVAVHIVYSESHFERRGPLSMDKARDRCDTVLSEGARDLYPTGPEGGDSIGPPDEDGYRTLTSQYRLVTVG